MKTKALASVKWIPWTLVGALWAWPPSPAWSAGTPRGPVTKDGPVTQEEPGGPAAAGEAAAPAADGPADRESALALAEKAQRDQDVAATVKALRALRIYSTLNERQESLIRAGVEHLEGQAYARAEKAFGSVAGGGQGAELAAFGLEVAKASRQKQEGAALEELEKTSDPRSAARTLVAGYAADPNSPNAKRGFQVLEKRIRAGFLTMTDAELAHAIEALSILENTEGDMGQRIAEASGILAKGRAAEAEAAYRDAKVGVLGDAESRVAGWAADWVRKRRIQSLENELAQVSAQEDVIAEDRVVQALLALDPKHPGAQRQARTLESRVVAQRLQSADQHVEQEQWGPAFIYLRKGLKTSPDDPKLTAKLDTVKAKLNEQKDLILWVPEVSGGESCEGFASQLQTETQKTTSRRDDLGAYVLSPGWTKAFVSNDPRAPKVEGALRLEVTDCKARRAGGQATVKWSVQVPREGDVRGEVAGGEVTVTVDSSLVPRDEQDAQGKGTMRQLSDRLATAVAEAITSKRDAMDQWLLFLGQVYQKRGEPEKAAHAYARLVLNKPLMVDDEAMAALGAELSERYR